MVLTEMKNKFLGIFIAENASPARQRDLIEACIATEKMQPVLSFHDCNNEILNKGDSLLSLLDKAKADFGDSKEEYEISIPKNDENYDEIILIWHLKKHWVFLRYKIYSLDFSDVKESLLYYLKCCSKG